MADADLATLAALDDDELYARLGGELLGDGLSFGPEDFARYRDFAVRWVREHVADLRARVCGRVPARDPESKGGTDALMDMAAVADCLVSLLGKPAATVAGVILVRRGLDTLCGSA